tara:strand:- start:6836 stop:7282 length:447 start_codon:yes stop_codon:yes gene_type:complete
MIIVNCKFNKKAKELYKSVNVKIKELERFTNFILNEYKGTRNIWNYDLEIRIIDCDTSGYYFGCNEMEIGTKTSKRSIAKKKEWYLSSYFHELCHFAQDNLDKVKDSKLDYTDADAANCTNKYYKNPMEIQAREFEDKYTKIYLELYS